MASPWLPPERVRRTESGRFGVGASVVALPLSLPGLPPPQPGRPGRPDRPRPRRPLRPQRDATPPAGLRPAAGARAAEFTPLSFFPGVSGLGAPRIASEKATVFDEPSIRLLIALDCWKANIPEVGTLARLVGTADLPPRTSVVEPMQPSYEL